MDLVGKFHKEETDEGVWLVYQDVKYPNSSDEEAKPLFVCPSLRRGSRYDSEERVLKITSSPLCNDRYDDHHVLPLFWCNNQDPDPDVECHACETQTIDKLDFTYVCSDCDFVVHFDCICKPKVIKMSRHRHRLSFVYSLPLKPWLCGVCRKEIDRDYGAFACNACSGYAVHTNCALRRDLWDGIDLEGVPEEEYEDVSAFKWIEDGFIMDHFSHDHHLKLEDSKVFDENKICQACGLPIYDGSFFSCGECNFILHEACAKAPRKTFTPSHPHQIQLEVMEDLIFSCNACGRHGNGFIYKCSNADCDVDEDFDSYLLDMRCAMVSEPFTYQGHPHPLYLSLDPEEETTCGVCKSTTNGRKAINCIVCEFTICFNCATLPYMVKYKHDEHFLTFSRGHETSESDWCEICEGKLAIIGKEKGFYKCEDCCTTLHIHCLLRIDPYLVAGKSVAVIKDSDIRTQRNISFSRKFCSQCAKRCPYPTLIASEEDVFCSIACRREYNEEMSWFRIV